MRKIKIGAKYKHFKGKIVKVLMIAKDSENLKEVFPACCKDRSDEFNTPEYITSRILSLFAPDGKLTETSREFLAYFRNSLISMDLDDDEYTDDNGI